jgi:hypothetical protein
MSTQNNDSSYLTLVRQQKALYAYKASLNTAILTNPNIVRVEQPTGQLLSVITNRKLGEQNCPCST